MKRQILKALTVLLIISALTGGMAACGKKEKAQMSSILCEKDRINF